MLVYIGFRFRGKSGTERDQKIRKFFFQIPYPRIDLVMRKVTHLSNVETIIVILIPICYILFSQRNVVALSAILIATFSSFFVTHIAKLIFRRLRPEFKKSINAMGYSFPSGHSAIGMAFYLTMAYCLTYEYMLFYILVPLAFLLGLSIAVSRIVLGVHWFTDVCFGTILGLLCAYWAIHAFEIGFYFTFLLKRI